MCQQILATIPKTFTVERLIIFGAPLFNPTEFQLFPRFTDSKETPEILQVNTTALSASAFLIRVVFDMPPEPSLFLYLSREPYDFTAIKPHPACIPSPETVSSIVLFFPNPVYNYLIIPMRVPFAFAHPRTTAVALITFFKCLNIDERIYLSNYPTTVARMFRSCNPVKISERCRNDWYKYAEEWAHILKGEYREKKARFVERVLEVPGWVLFVSIMPVRDDPGAEELGYGFVRKDGEKLEILSIPEIVGVDGMEDLQSELWENEISRGFVKTRAGKNVPIRLLMENQVRALE
ncbi:hypothetical protein K440DRAFT_629812 [Wilcoxina mikolae CBS 423.85]|nr:hypothetical protein K440DRAFT_629812 [Wilcoxina mikolae CBS 423.85]